MEIWLGTHALFIDHVTGSEAIEPIGPTSVMEIAGCEKMREAPAGCGCCLEAAVAPPCIDVEAIHWRSIDNR